jgi:hypothetical protein
MLLFFASDLLSPKMKWFTRRNENERGRTAVIQRDINDERRRSRRTPGHQVGMSTESIRYAAARIDSVVPMGKRRFARRGWSNGRARIRKSQRRREIRVMSNVVPAAATQIDFKFRR